jgi:hypothetical protein
MQFLLEKLLGKKVAGGYDWDRGQGLYILLAEDVEP